MTLALLGALGCAGDAQGPEGSPLTTAELPDLPTLAEPAPWTQSLTLEDLRSLDRDPFEPIEKTVPPPPVIVPPDGLVAESAQVATLALSAVMGPDGQRVALVVDDAGNGHPVRVGDFVGAVGWIRDASSDMALPVWWRVDAIREDSLVFIRQDSPGAAPKKHRIEL